MVLVKVDVFSRLQVHLAMNGLDDVEDVKGLLGEVLGIHPWEISLVHDPKSQLLSGTQLKDLGGETVKFMMVQPTVSEAKVVDELKGIQDAVKDGHVKIHDFHGATLRTFKTFVSLASHNLSPPQKKPSPSQEDTSASSSSGSKKTLQALKERIAQIESEIREKKQDVKQLLLECRDVPIRVDLRQPSGNILQITTKTGKTVLQCKKEDIKGKVSELSVHDMQLIYGNEVMRDGKRLYSYGIDDGFVLDFIKLNRSPFPVEDAVPEVAPLEAEESEEEVGEDIGEDEIYRLLDEPDYIDMDESHMHRCDVLDNRKLVSLFVRNGGKISMHFNPLRVGVQKVMDEVADITSIPLDEFRLVGMHSRQEWQPHQALWSVPQVDQYQAYLVLVGLRGGGFGVKKHITKEKAMLEKKDKIKKMMADTVEIPAGVIFSTEFSSHEEKCKEKLGEIKMMFAQGVPVMRLALKNVSVGNLEVLKSIMEKKVRGNRGESTDAKFQQTLEYLFPMLLSLENECKVLKNMHSEFVAFFMEKFVENYGVFSETEQVVKLNPDKFLVEIMTELNSRDASSQNAVNVEQSNCIIN